MKFGERTMKFRWLAVALVLFAFSSATAENMLKNSSFEERVPGEPWPKHWDQRHLESLPMEFSGEHHHGAVGGMIPGDGKPYMWRQNVVAPKARSFTLSGWFKA